MTTELVESALRNSAGVCIGREAEARVLDRELRYWIEMEVAPERVIGRAIASLVDHNGLMALGYSCLKDYARERIGISVRQAQELAQMERALSVLPNIAAAYDAQVLTKSHVRLLIRRATPDSECEWLEKARGCTVRQLMGRRKAKSKGRWIEDDVPLEVADIWDEAVELVRRKAGHDISQSECLEVMLLDFFQTKGAMPECDVPDDSDEDEMRMQTPSAPQRDPFELDMEIQQALGTARGARKELRVRLRRMSQMLLYRELGYTSMRDYASERLGMKERTLKLHLELAHDLTMNEPLQRALDEGRLHEGHVRLLVDVVCPSTVDEWIEHAATRTVLQLAEDVRKADKALEEGRISLVGCRPSEVQTCAQSAPPEENAERHLRVFLPFSLREMWSEMQRITEGKPAGVILGVLAMLYLNANSTEAMEMARRHPIPARDEWKCAVPGCSRRGGLHVHHVKYRSQGGDDSPANLITLCAPHHHHGVHAGRIRVSGLAPNGLTWELGVRPNGRPHRVVVGTRFVDEA